MIKWLTELTEPGKDGPGKMLLLAEKFGILPNNINLLLGGLRSAPAPKRTELGTDWISNLDVLSHSIGCVAAGVFDNMVEGMTESEIAAVSKDDFVTLLDEMPMKGVLGSTFDVCKAVYLEYGSVSDAIAEGLVKPEGMMTQAFISPLIEKKKSEQTAPNETSMLKRLLRQKSNSGSSVPTINRGDDQGDRII